MKNIRLVVMLIVLVVVLVGPQLLRIGNAQDRAPNGVILPPQPAPGPDGSLRVMLIGDAGTGSDDTERKQFKVARAAEQVCAQRGCDIALGLGDNIYESGINPDLGSADPQWRDKFETPYQNLNIPFFMTLGNHDTSGPVGGDGTRNGRGNLEVDYHYEGPGKWQMPARYYSFSYGNVQFFNLDTNPLIGTEAFEPTTYAVTTYGAAQQQWLQTALANSTATWKFVYGHHPILSNGAHGNAGSFDGVPGNGEFLRQLAVAAFCDKADLYFNGHDHDLQWLKPTASCGRTEFMVSGAAAKKRSLGNPNRNSVFYQKGDLVGFAWLEIKGHTLTGAFYEVDSTDPESRPIFLYERSFTKPVDPQATMTSTTVPPTATMLPTPTATIISPTITPTIVSTSTASPTMSTITTIATPATSTPTFGTPTTATATVTATITTTIIETASATASTITATPSSPVPTATVTTTAGSTAMPTPQAVPEQVFLPFIGRSQ